MRKILFYTAALAAMVSCNDAKMDTMAPEIRGENGCMITITANTATETADADTRVNVGYGVDGMWDVYWGLKDNIAAYGENDLLTYYYLQDETDGKYDSTIGRFKGVAANGFGRLVYALTMKDDDDYPTRLYLDLTKQEEGMDKNSIVMVSSEKVDLSKDITAVEMQHIGAAVEMVLYFETDTYKDYKVNRIDVTGLCSYAVLECYNATVSGVEKRPITINDATPVQNDQVKARFSILPTVLAKDENVMVFVHLSKEGGDDVTLSQTITVPEELNFERAKHHTINCRADKWISAYWTDMAAETFAEGDGSQSAPFKISNEAEIAKLANDVNSGNDYSGKYFELTADLNLLGREWTAIGSSKESAFRGLFDGGKHTISGLYINQPSKDYQGLFGYVSLATIQNVSVSGSVVGLKNVGGIVGTANGYVSGASITGCKIIGCNFSGSILGPSGNAGGIVGNMIDGGKTSILANCYNSGSVVGGGWSGGVAGSAGVAAATNCYNSGSVKGKNNVGGLFGESAYATTNCYNSGSVEGYANNWSAVGGIAGLAYKSDTFTNCYNSGTVKNTGATSCGGIVGDSHTETTITYCYYLEGTAEQGKGEYPDDLMAESKSAKEMQGSEFLDLLNNTAKDLNGETDTACEWKSGVDSYPTLNLGVYRK